ncbi:Protein TORNADO 1 [Hibiscus syriacus]|uniref:Protein TORNADO 1 n=1 Tax=Hibiscus syriacus TaxID=106335 RepID=A0A6A2ZHR2_HIBSY|nr:Protein TORNADO 1 [Hibiscus syriacus]
MNSTVTSLDMTGVRLKSRWAKEFRWVLEQNQTLKEVTLSKTGLKDKGIVCVAAGLQEQAFGTLASRWKPVQWYSHSADVNRQQTLTRLAIIDDQSTIPDDFFRIFKSLEKNASLRCSSLRGCKGVRGDRVLHLQAIMETLQINPWIEDIDFARTSLHDTGKADAIYQRLGQNGKTEPEPENDLLKDMPLTEPKSCRLFFCGQEYAGKATLCNSKSQNFSSSKLPYIEQVKTLVNPVEQAVRTVGMKIKTFKDEDTKISIWNLAGQHEFHVSWAWEFIVSNSKRAVQQCMLPNVAVVLAHYDRVNQTSQNLQDTVTLIQKLRDKFNGYVDFYPTVFTDDARSSASVSKLTHHIRKTSKTVLQRVPRVYQLCNDLIQILSDWRSENCNKPAMKWKEFSELCQVKVPPLRIQSRHDNKEKIEMRRRVVATGLHHMGERLEDKARPRTDSSAGKNWRRFLRGSLHSQIPGMGSKVHLHNRIMALKNQHGATYSLEKYPIAIKINGIHIQVELGGQLGYYIDILACSTKSLTETLRLINQLIVPTIQSLCHGVTLTKNILRPESESMYDYKHTWDSVSDSGKVVLRDGFDLARDLLSDDDFREVLHRRYHDPYNLAVELQVPPENNPDEEENPLSNVLRVTKLILLLVE